MKNYCIYFYKNQSHLQYFSFFCDLCSCNDSVALWVTVYTIRTSKALVVAPKLSLEEGDGVLVMRVQIVSSSCIQNIPQLLLTITTSRCMHYHEQLVDSPRQFIVKICDFLTHTRNGLFLFYKGIDIRSMLSSCYFVLNSHFINNYCIKIITA